METQAEDYGYLSISENKNKEQAGNFEPGCVAFPQFLGNFSFVPAARLQIP